MTAVQVQEEGLRSASLPGGGGSLRPICGYDRETLYEIRSRTAPWSSQN